MLINHFLEIFLFTFLWYFFELNRDFVPCIFYFWEVSVISDRTRINEMIRVKEVRVIDNDGAQLGVMPTKKALEIAAEKKLDLVEVAPNSKPVVCKIMDYGKYKYEQA